MLQAAIAKNDKKARLLIFVFSAIVFTAVVVLSRVKLNVNLGFDVHLFAKANAMSMSPFLGAAITTPDEKYKKGLGNNTVLVSINGTLGSVAFYNNEPIVLGKSACYFNLAEGIYKQFIKDCNRESRISSVCV